MATWRLMPVPTSRAYATEIPIPLLPASEPKKANLTSPESGHWRRTARQKVATIILPPSEFGDLDARLKSGLPYQPGAAELDQPLPRTK